MSTDLRLASHPSLPINRGRTVFLRINDKPISAYEGETLGAALHAAGVKIFSRSIGALCTPYIPQLFPAYNAPMPNYCRARVDGGTYFFTVNTFRRQTFLTDADVHRVPLVFEEPHGQTSCPWHPC